MHTLRGHVRSTYPQQPEFVVQFLGGYSIILSYSLWCHSFCVSSTSFKLTKEKLEKSTILWLDKENSFFTNNPKHEFLGHNWNLQKLKQLISVLTQFHVSFLLLFRLEQIAFGGMLSANQTPVRFPSRNSCSVRICGIRLENTTNIPENGLSWGFEPPSVNAGSQCSLCVTTLQRAAFPKRAL